MDIITRTKTKNITITKNKNSVIFYVQSIIAQPMWLPTLLLLPSPKSSWIFNNAENNPNIPVKFPKYNRRWKLSENIY